MARFYLALGVALALPARSAAQPPASQERPPLGSTFTVDALGELPSSASVFTLLDTSIPDVITDRVDTGGVSAGKPARSGAHGSTWTQTLFRLGDADITDPSGSGAPLLSPGVVEWDRVDVSTGIMPVEASAPGMAVLLSPRRPSASWQRSLDLFVSPSFLNAGGATTEIPSIARIDSWAHGNFIAGGPVSGDRLGAFVSAAYTTSSHFERRGVTPIDANIGSLFVNLTGAPRSSDHLRLTGWAQRTRDPMAQHAALKQPTAAEHDSAVHAQGAWEHQLADASAGFRAYGSFTTRRRRTELAPMPFVVVERLTDGPVPTLLEAGDGSDRVVNLGGRVHKAIDGATGAQHALSGGIEITGSSMGMQSAFAGRVGELVNGVPARAWLFTDPVEPSNWRSLLISAFASDTVTWGSRLTLDGAVRLETVRGYPNSSANSPSISWNGAYPRGGLHVALTDVWKIATFAQYARYAHRLPLRDLAYGDPSAPTADIYRWRGGNLLLPGSLGPLVQKLGPGSGGNASFSAIDPNLTRPKMDEMIFGFESRPRPQAFVRMAALARREATLVGVVNVGVPESTYTEIGVPDTNIDRIGNQDDQILVFYNRSPSTFGQDRYLLTNPSDHVATFVGVDFVGEVHARRFFGILGGTAGRSEGLSANRGFGVLENDAGLLGEVFVNPNARGHAQGRVFTERGYTIKMAMAYQFERDFTFALVGRYQDGQHFARMVVLEDLNQGPEAVRAFRNGRTRFFFSMTVDARLQKTFTVGTRTFTLVADAYNVANQALAVEEAQVTGAGERQMTAVQPPRVFHVGVRIPF